MGGYCGPASSGLKTGIKMLLGGANKDEEDNDLWNPRVAFVGVKDGHSEDGNHPADECNDNNAYHDGHAATTHGRKKLTANNAGNGTVSDHNNHIEEAGDLCGPVSHEVSSHNLIGSAFANCTP